MIKLAKIGGYNATEYPEWLSKELKEKQFDNWIEHDKYVAKRLDKMCPVNGDDISKKMIEYLANKDGYARFKSWSNRVYFLSKIYTRSTPQYTYLCIYEIDETHPWTVLRLEEYEQIIYLDTFECVDKENNYYEIKKEDV